MEKLIGPTKAAEARQAFFREVVTPESPWGDREKLRLAGFVERTNIELVFELDPDLPEIPFDLGHLRQVILNIAKNGIEAMSAGGTLTINTGQQAGRVFVQVCDTGKGIPPEIREKVFQPFFSSKPKGTGLGLAISQKIVEAHQGEIAIDSEPQKGTRVTIFLPAMTR